MKKYVEILTLFLIKSEKKYLSPAYLASGCFVNFAKQKHMSLTTKL